jgi:hypothetical protein
MGVVARSRPMAARLVGEILRGLTAGLAAIHWHGWCHRDIKPENVLLGEVRRRPRRTQRRQSNRIVSRPSRPSTRSGARARGAGERHSPRGVRRGVSGSARARDGTARINAPPPPPPGNQSAFSLVRAAAPSLYVPRDLDIG